MERSVPYGPWIDHATNPCIPGQRPESLVSLRSVTVFVYSTLMISPFSNASSPGSVGSKEYNARTRVMIPLPCPGAGVAGELVVVGAPTDDMDDEYADVAL